MTGHKQAPFRRQLQARQSLPPQVTSLPLIILDIMNTKPTDRNTTNSGPCDKRAGLDTDDQILAHLGHEQELRREFSVFTLAALCSCLMASWEALATVIATALTNGGPPCLFYN